jgi:hypothetical protein
MIGSSAPSMSAPPLSCGSDAEASPFDMLGSSTSGLLGYEPRHPRTGSVSSQTPSSGVENGNCKKTRETGAGKPAELAQDRATLCVRDSGGGA